VRLCCVSVSSCGGACIISHGYGACSCSTFGLSIYMYIGSGKWGLLFLCTFTFTCAPERYHEWARLALHLSGVGLAASGVVWIRGWKPKGCCKSYGDFGFCMWLRRLVKWTLFVHTIETEDVILFKLLGTLRPSLGLYVHTYSVYYALSSERFLDELHSRLFSFSNLPVDGQNATPAARQVPPVRSSLAQPISTRATVSISGVLVPKRHHQPPSQATPNPFQLCPLSSPLGRLQAAANTPMSGWPPSIHPFQHWREIPT
jgi:hypothetical protein